MRARTCALWVVVVAAFLFSLAAILSVGMFTLPVALAGAVLLLVRPSRERGLAVLLAAAAMGPLIVALLNREGPGRVCHNYPPDGIACGDRRVVAARAGGAPPDR